MKREEKVVSDEGENTNNNEIESVRAVRCNNHVKEKAEEKP